MSRHVPLPFLIRQYGILASPSDHSVWLLSLLEGSDDQSLGGLVVSSLPRLDALPLELFMI